MSASASPTPGVSSAPPANGAGNRIRQFWQRLSEGRQIDELWSQFTADARASYTFYMKEADEEELGRRHGVYRFLHIAKTLFWSMLMKMTPARRVLLLIALVMLVMSGFKFQFGRNLSFDVNFVGIAALLFLLLLSLELADKVTMKRDLEIAREIQTWLVPSEPPQVPGADIAFATRPQNSVAGDYYDAFYPDPENKERVVLVIADVAGKSVPAALLMATLQARVAISSAAGVPVAELVTRLNRYASAYSLDGRRFTTAVLCEYDLGSRRLTYVNAGHNAPILRRADGEFETLETGGLPLGIKIGAEYETATVELRETR